jgi:hypothetical protein
MSEERVIDDVSLLADARRHKQIAPPVAIAAKLAAR